MIGEARIKAQELIHKYIDLQANVLYKDGKGNSCVVSGNIVHTTAKKIAIISVEDIIKNIREINEKPRISQCYESLVFWLEVKKQIEFYE